MSAASKDTLYQASQPCMQPSELHPVAGSWIILQWIRTCCISHTSAFGAAMSEGLDTTSNGSFSFSINFDCMLNMVVIRYSVTCCSQGPVDCAIRAPT